MIWFFALFFLAVSGGSLSAKEAVILLHGLSRSDSSMKAVERTLVREGYYVLNVDYPSRTAEIADLSELVIGTALRDCGVLESAKVHFVTHSLGGILVRSYFGRYELERLGRVVMLGPPNKGSEIVDRIGSWRLFERINGPAGRELGTSSASTPSLLGPVEFELGVIAGDRSINWINSLMIKGPDDGKVSVERAGVEGMKEQIVVHTTHPFMMKNEEVLRQVVHFLARGEFATQEPTSRSTER